MISNINFTGLKNIGAMFNIEINTDRKNIAGYLKPIERKYLLVKLTNDKFGNDLDEYEQTLALGTPELDNFKFLHDKRYVNIITEKPYHSTVPPKLFLNLEELPIHENTLPMFDFLAKLTRKIANKQDNDFIYEDKFPMCDAGDLFIMGDTRISEISRNQREYIDKTLYAYNPKMARHIAKTINNSIQEQYDKQH